MRAINDYTQEIITDKNFRELIDKYYQEEINKGKVALNKKKKSANAKVYALDKKNYVRLNRTPYDRADVMSMIDEVDPKLLDWETRELQQLFEVYESYIVKQINRVENGGFKKNKQRNENEVDENEGQYVAGLKYQDKIELLHTGRYAIWEVWSNRNVEKWLPRRRVSKKSLVKSMLRNAVAKIEVVDEQSKQIKRVRKYKVKVCRPMSSMMLTKRRLKGLTAFWRAVTFKHIANTIGAEFRHNYEKRLKIEAASWEGYLEVVEAEEKGQNMSHITENYREIIDWNYESVVDLLTKEKDVRPPWRCATISRMKMGFSRIYKCGWRGRSKVLGA